MKSWVIAVLAVLWAGCPSDDAPPDEGCEIAGDPTLEIGVPDPVTFLNFEALVAGGEIPLSSNGQTFLAVQLAVRATNLDRFVNIEMNVTYTPNVGEPRTATKTPEETERLFCREEGGVEQLDLVPVVVSSEDLGDDVEIQDQAVDVDITVTDDSGRTVSGTANGVLTRI